MDLEVYNSERARLNEVLEDAIRRGDYYLELDVKEALSKLQDEWYKSE